MGLVFVSGNGVNRIATLNSSGYNDACSCSPDLSFTTASSTFDFAWFGDGKLRNLVHVARWRAKGDNDTC